MSGWTRVPLSTVATVTMGQSPPGDSYNSEGRGLPLFQGKAEFSALHAQPTRFTTAGGRTGEAGDILLSVRAPVGPTNLAPLRAVLGRGVAGVRALPGLDQRFLLWALRCTEGELAAKGAGSTFSAVTGPRVRAHQIPFHPCEHLQRRVVAIIEEHFASLDAADRALADARARQNVLAAKTIDSVLVNATPRPLAELLASPLANGRSVPTADSGFPVLRLTALRGGTIDLTERKIGAWAAPEAQRFLVKRGDFLVSRGNGSLSLVGRGALVADEPDAVAFPDTMIRVRPDPEVLDPDFLAQVWKSQAVRRQIESAARTTAGIHKISQKDLARIEVPWLAREAQASAAKLVLAMTEYVGSLEAAHRAIALKSAALRRAILTAAFTGRLTGASADADVLADAAIE